MEKNHFKKVEKKNNLELGQMLLGLTSTPWLFSILAFDSIVENLIEIGISSEEVFRGVSLPMLNVTDLESLADSEIEQNPN